MSRFPETHPDTPRLPFKLATAAAVWLAVVAAVLVRMIAYSNVPGAAGMPPAEWPAESRLPRPAGQPMLVLFAHPRCPCTRASLGELERLMAQAQGRLVAQVLFLKLAGTGENWARTDLWRTAAAIPGVVVAQDDDGVEARLFHSETSGDTLLYDADGHRIFHGGITLSRGHAGDNPGRSAIAALLDEPAANAVSTPVFGCSLFAKNCRKGDAP